MAALFAKPDAYCLKAERQVRVGSTYSLYEKADARLEVGPNGSLLPDC